MVLLIADYDKTSDQNNSKESNEDEGTNTETLDTKKKSLQKDVEDLESSLTSAKSEAVESEPEQPKPKTPVDETKEEKPKPKGRSASRSNSKKLLDVEKCESYWVLKLQSAKAAKCQRCNVPQL